MLEVEQWAELRREHFVCGIAIKKVVRRTGLSRNTIPGGIAFGRTAEVQVPRATVEAGSVQGGDPLVVKDDPKLPGVRVRELIEPLGFDGGQTIVDDYLREVRPMFLKLRTHQRTVYRPGEICQWDLWEPSGPVPVGHGQVRRGWVVVGCLGYSRAGAGALVFSPPNYSTDSSTSTPRVCTPGESSALIYVPERDPLSADHRPGPPQGG